MLNYLQPKVNLHHQTNCELSWIDGDWVGSERYGCVCVKERGVGMEKEEEKEGGGKK